MIKKFVGDFAYILLAVVLVFGVVTLAFPAVNVDLTSAVPLAPATPPYVEEIETLALYFEEGFPSTVTVLVLNFWSPTCEYCLEELLELNVVAQYRSDIAVVALTTETDLDAINAITEGLELNYSAIYGLPEPLPLSTLPNTHVLIKMDGEWRLLSGGTWIGFVRAETIIQFILDNSTEE